MIAAAPQGKAAWEEGSKIFKMNLESGAVEILLEHIHSAQLQPGQDASREPALLDGTLAEKKAVPLPFSAPCPAQVLGGDRSAFVVNSEKHELWFVDLNKDRWSRIY